MDPGIHIHVQCPHYYRPFPIHQICPNCKAAIIGLNLKVGGTIKVCSRNGCKHHSLEFEDSQDALNLFRSQNGSSLF